MITGKLKSRLAALKAAFKSKRGRLECQRTTDVLQGLARVQTALKQADGDFAGAPLCAADGADSWYARVSRHYRTILRYEGMSLRGLLADAHRDLSPLLDAADRFEVVAAEDHGITAERLQSVVNQGKRVGLGEWRPVTVRG